MQIQRLGPAGAERPVVRDGDEYYDLTPLTADIDGAFLAGGGLQQVRAALDAGELVRADLPSDVRIGAPVARPGAVICIGQNYAAHAAESGASPPTDPIVFFKHPNTVVGPDDDVQVPAGSERLDWEVELAVVIGASASGVSVDDALGHVAGYTIANDVSERDWQINQSGGQWAKGKCGPTFCPLGPALVPAEQVDPTGLGLRSWVNGEPRQDSTTADMIFPVATLIADLSTYMTLDPGDVVLTGTPEGVALSGRYAYLQPGDVMELEVDGLGRQRQRLRGA